MFKHMVIGLLVVGACTLGAEANAGGYVGIRPLDVPTRMTLGQRVEVSFMLEAQDGTPMRQLSPFVVLRHGDRTLQVPASESKVPGRYVASVRASEAGRWTMTIDSRLCGNARALPALTVVAAATH